MNPNKIIQLAMKAGSMLLECGAETYRVEDTIVRICDNYGMEDTNCFCTQTGIMLSSIYDGTTYAQVARIKARNTNLDRIGKINQLSRDARVLEINDFEKELLAIKNSETYSLPVSVFFAGICTFGFTLLFKGMLIDAIASFVIGCGIRYLSLVLDEKELNSFFSIAVCSSLITIVALLLEFSGIIENRTALIVGTIMLLVPGLAITNAIRDSIAGDLVSGIARATEAMLIAVAVALGSGLAMTIWLSLGGMI